MLTNDEALSQIIPSDLRDRLVVRANADNLDGPNTPLSDLLDYTDFLDAEQLLRRLHQGARLPPNIDTVCRSLDALARIRNRVMHSRPLRQGDLAIAKEQCSRLSALRDVRLQNIVETADRLATDSSFLLSLNLPKAGESIFTNVPPPDCDDTGLIGRERDVDNLTALLLSNRPIVTLLGEGGVGKSAVAIETLFRLLDHEKLPYKAIVWTSLKTQGFGPGGVSQISRDIAGAHAVYSALESSVLPSGKATLEDLLEYLEVFPTLLVIDNLETINVGDLRELFRRLPASSKILVTSRIGIGEFEERYVLAPLSKADSVVLIRALAALLNVEHIKSMSNEGLGIIADELYHNPLALRWYVGSIANGGDPQLTSIQKTELLRYCFANVINALEEPARAVLQVFQCIKRPLTAGEISFFLLDADYLSGLNQLLRTSVLRTSVNRVTLRTVYMLADFAAEFLRRDHPVPKSTVQRFMITEASVKSAVQRAEQSARHNKYEPWAVVLLDSDPETAIAATYLSAAVRLARVEPDRAKSLTFLERAKKIAPDSPEVYKVAGYVYAKFGEIDAAEEQYQIALDKGGREHPHIVALYGQFLYREVGRYGEGLRFAQEALTLERHPATLFYAGRAHLYLHDFDAAVQLFDEIIKIERYDGDWWARATLAAAIDVCRSAVEDPKRDPDLWFERGLEYASSAAHSLLWDRKTKEMCERLIVAHTQRRRPESDAGSSSVIEKWISDHSIVFKQVAGPTVDRWHNALRRHGVVQPVLIPADQSEGVAQNEPIRIEGRVLRWWSERGFGFAQSAHDGVWYYVSKFGVRDGNPDGLREGSRIEFEAARSFRAGQANRAVNVRIIEAGRVLAGPRLPAVAPVHDVRAWTDENSELRNRVLERLRQLVRDSPEAVVMAHAAHVVIDEFGPMLYQTYWFGSGSFREFLTSFPNPGFVVDPSLVPGYIYDAVRHRPPKRLAPEYLAEVPTEMVSLIDRIQQVAHAPSLSPSGYRNVFESVAEHVNAEGFVANKATRPVRDLCGLKGTKISLKNVEWILQVLAREGAFTSGQPLVATQLASMLRNTIIDRVSVAGTFFSDDELELMNRWLLSWPAEAQRPMGANDSIVELDELNDWLTDGDA